MACGRLGGGTGWTRLRAKGASQKLELRSGSGVAFAKQYPLNSRHKGFRAPLSRSALIASVLAGDSEEHNARQTAPPVWRAATECSFMSKPTDPRFNEPLPGDRSPSAATYRFDKEHAKAVQTALFEHIKVRTDRGPHRMTRLDAVIRQLNQDCLQGNPSAIREQDKLVALLREKNDLAPADPDSDRAKFHKRIKDDKQRREDHIPFFFNMLHVS